jgi:hypothetical protein
LPFTPRKTKESSKSPHGKHQTKRAAAEEKELSIPRGEGELGGKSIGLDSEKIFLSQHKFERCPDAEPDEPRMCVKKSSTRNVKRIGMFGPNRRWG